MYFFTPLSLSFKLKPRHPLFCSVQCRYHLPLQSIEVTSPSQSTSVILSFFCLKLPPRGFAVADECLWREWTPEPELPPLGPPPPPLALSRLSLSVGECTEPRLRLDRLDDRCRLDDMPRLLGYGLEMSKSSPGRQDSTIMAFSRQLTNSSAVSELPEGLAKVPANRHSPPNPIPLEREVTGLHSPAFKFLEN